MPGRTAKKKRKPAGARKKPMTAEQLSARGKKAAATRERNRRAKARRAR